MSAPADKYFTYGVIVGNSPRFLVAGNTISNLLNSRPGPTNLRAITINASKNSSIKDNTVENIRAIAQTSASSVSGISTSGAYGGSAAEITGNLIRDVHNWAASFGGAPAGILIHSDTDDVSIAGNHIEHADIGISIYNSSRTMLSGNFVTNCGQLISYGNCENANDPMVLEETVPVTSNATFARSAAQAYEGFYSYLFDNTAAVGGRVDLVNSLSTTEMHGLIAGVEYTLEMWIYIPSGIMTGTDATIRILDYNGAWNATNATAANTYDAWQKVTVTRELSADAAGASVRIYDAAGSGASDDEFYVDNVRLFLTNHQNAHENCFLDNGTNTRF